MTRERPRPTLHVRLLAVPRYRGAATRRLPPDGRQRTPARPTAAAERRRKVTLRPLPPYATAPPVARHRPRLYTSLVRAVAEEHRPTTMPHRNVIFVGHANPEDNTFARWLSLKLAALGYLVWSDVTKLLGGEDFWNDIEYVIRTQAVKYVYVLSRPSNRKPGTLKELRVANAIARRENLRDFVIPLRLDDLPHDEINIELGRLNAIDFAEWAPGLKQLCEKLEVDGVPRSSSCGAGAVRTWWERAFAADAGVNAEPEIHYSNWFPLQLPSWIHRHSAIGLLATEPQWAFPTQWHRSGLLTFASAAEVEPGLAPLRLNRTERLDLAEFLSEDNPHRRDNRNLVTALLREAWERYAVASGLQRLTMASGRAVFYFRLDALPNPNVRFLSVDGTATYRALMGYRKRQSGHKRHWHFAVSARPAVHPQPMLQIRAHVLFSDDGLTLWSSPSAMHRARRSQCKNWWNDDWRDRILATMTWLARDGRCLVLPLSTGQAAAVVAARPLEFLSPVSVRPLAARQPDEETDETEDDEAFGDADPPGAQP